MGLKEENADLKLQVSGLNKRVENLLDQLAALAFKLDKFMEPEKKIGSGPAMVPTTKLAFEIASPFTYCYTHNTAVYQYKLLFKPICDFGGGFSGEWWMGDPKTSQEDQKCCGYWYGHQNNRTWLECTPKNSDRINFQCGWIGFRHEDRNRGLIGEAKSHSTSSSSALTETGRQSTKGTGPSEGRSGKTNIAQAIFVSNWYRR